MTDRLGQAAEEARLAREAAARVFDALMSSVPRPARNTAEDRLGVEAASWAADRLTEVLTLLADAPADLLGHGRKDMERSSGHHPVGTLTARGEPVRLSGPPGGEARTLVWVHSLGAVEPDSLILSVTALVPAVGEPGSPVPGSSARFEPAEVQVGDGWPRSSSLLRLPIPADAAPGAYQGLVVGRGRDQWVVEVRLVVT